MDAQATIQGLTLMNNILPYQYIGIKRQSMRLMKAYQTMNDPKMIETYQSLIQESVEQIFTEPLPEVEAFLNVMMDRTMTRHQLDKQLELLKIYVEPFKVPSNQQLDKLFKKVKKLKYQNWADYELTESTYIGWNDPGQQKKFIIFYHEGELRGLYGDLSPSVNKGVCPICKNDSKVSMFLATTKIAGDGTYTKNGNYICHDSRSCNKQLDDLTGLYEFLAATKTVL
ncbi:FusB/FusC family EF-G-binding protein [Macrococcus equipercicus]|nr:FusB/FusC family EF-G-binding protein [Macrococcus equipercicus]